MISSNNDCSFYHNHRSFEEKCVSSIRLSEAQRVFSFLRRERNSAKLKLKEMEKERQKRLKTVPNRFGSRSYDGLFTTSSIDNSAIRKGMSRSFSAFSSRYDTPFDKVILD
jgi:hypothetical protein